MKKKVLVLVLAALVFLAGTAGVMLAHHLANPTPAPNTYTKGRIELSLTENTGPQFTMVPGQWIERDAKVTVRANSEKCWLFLKVTEENGLKDYIEYGLTPGWKQAEELPENVFYYEQPVEEDPVDQYIYILSYEQEENKVKVRGDIPKEKMEALRDKSEEELPRLYFTAYASPYWKEEKTPYTVLEAWNNVNPNP